MRLAAVTAVSAYLAAATPGLARAGTPDDEEPVTSYRNYTIAADAVSMGFFLVGASAEGPGGEDTDASEVFMSAGFLGLSLAAPIIHAARGHGTRALASFGMRAGLASLGMMVAVGMRSGCDGWFCELDYAGYGIIGGYAVAAVIDAATLTDEPAPRANRSWTPVISPTGAGIAGSF